MGRVVKAETTHRKATMAIMKKLGKEYTFSNIKEFNIFDYSEDTMFIASQGDTVYAVNVPENVLDGEEVPYHEVPSSVLYGEDRDASAMSSVAERLRKYAPEYTDVADEISDDSERMSARQKVKITIFERKNDQENRSKQSTEVS